MSSVFYIICSFIMVSALGAVIYEAFFVHRWKIVGPFSIAMLCYVYYTSLGPLIMAYNRDLYWNGYDLRAHADKAAWIALASFCSFIFTYFVSRRHAPPIDVNSNDVDYRAFSFSLWGVAFILQIILAGGDMTRLFNVAGGDIDLNSASVMSQGFVNYLFNTCSFMIFCICCLYFCWCRRKCSLAPLVVMAIISILMFIATGFRLRIVALLLACSTVYVLINSRRIKTSFVVLSLTAVFAVGCIMGAARAYGRGIQFDRLTDFSVSEIILAGFDDSGIFYTSGMVVDHIQTGGGQLTWFNTYYCGLTRAIPSELWTNKPMSETLAIIADSHGGDANAWGAGFFVPFYAENYISFGYLGVILGSAFFAWIIGFAERRLLNGKVIGMLAYSVFSGYVFIYFHRGLFPQQFDFFVFMFLPILFCIILFKERRVVISSGVNR